MKKWLKIFGLLVLLGFGLAQKTSGKLTAIPVGYAPMLDGAATEDYWAKAPLLEVKTVGGGKWGAANNSATTVQIKAAYTPDSLFMLIRWADPTNSLDRQRWAFDGKTWIKEDQIPLNQGGGNTFNEDKLALFWVMNAPSVLEAGNFLPLYRDPDTAAKAGYDRPVKAAAPGETLDLWYYKNVRMGYTDPPQVDDQYMDSTYDVKSYVEAGRHSDAQGTPASGYYDNTKEYTAPDGSKLSGPKFYIPANNNLFVLTQDQIDRGEAKEIPDYAALMAFPAGTKFASVVSRPFTGSRGDIRGRAVWKDGWYTLELARKLDTSDAKNDLIFSDLSKPYYFGVATFDNSQIAHGYSDLYEMVLGK